VRAAEDAAFVHGKDGFGDIGYAASARRAESEPAAQAIVRLVRERPGELTLVMLGPLTNLALAMRLDPTLPQHVRRLVVMGGAVTGRGNTTLIPAEFNISFDPEAADVVFSGWPLLELVDWEATVAHGIDFAAFSRWLEARDPRARFYREISRRTLEFVHERGRPRMLSADALAMTAVLEPDAVEDAVERHVAIELDGRLTRGATVVDWDRRGGRCANARIALRLSQARFERLAAAALGAA
jgi:purine nucleosidase